MTAALPATLAAILALPLLAAPVAAQQRPPVTLSFDLGLGIKSLPEYEGSDQEKTEAWPIFRSFGVSVGGQDQGTGGVPQGFSYGSSFVLIDKLKTGSTALAPLRGLDPVDSGVEAGLRVSYRTGPVRVYGAARKAIRGHRGVTGEVGVSLISHPAENWTLTSSLEAQYGDSKFMEAYFGISPEEAARSGHSEHDVDGGIKAHALSIEARYDVNPDWAVLGRLQAKRLVGDAADSPVTRDREQLWVGLGVVRSFNFRF